MEPGIRSREEMERLIVTVLRDLAAEVLPEDLTQDTPLFGDHGLLDSVGLVSLVVGVEQAIQERFGIALSLADEKALSQRQSPYRTVGSLADYAFRAM